MIVILGKKGQLASSFQKFSRKETVALGSEQIPFSKPEQVLLQLEKQRPKIVINCAGVSSVEIAETDRERTLQINAKTPEQIAKWCAEHGALLIHFSSDQVFDGHGAEPWVESDKLGPLNFLGETKVIAERAIKESTCRYLIFRSSWVYSAQGASFLRHFLNQARSQTELKVASDKFGSPTAADDIARGVLKVLEKTEGLQEIPSGIFHLSAKGYCSLFDFAQEIYSQAASTGFDMSLRKLIPVSSKEINLTPARPLNCKLSNQRLLKTFGVQLPDWSLSLSKVMQEMRRSL